MADWNTLPDTPFNTPIGKQFAIKALLESGIPIREIAEECGVSPNTVLRVKRRFPSNNSVVETLKKTLPSAFYTMSTLALANISPKKLADSSALQLATVSGICVDKARDMEGSNRPIVNIVTMVGDISKGLNELKAKQQALLALKTSGL